MSPERHVKVFKNGRNQAIRIPREFEFSGEEAIMRKEGDRLIIEPAPPKSLLAVLATRKEKWPSTSAQLEKRKFAPASSSRRNCVMGLPRKAHCGFPPSWKRCL